MSPAAPASSEPRPARSFTLEVERAPDGRALGAYCRVNGDEYVIAPCLGQWEIIGGDRETPPLAGCAELTPAAILGALRRLGHVA